MKIFLVFLLCCGWVASGSELIKTSQPKKYENLSSQSQYIQDNNFGIVDVLSLPESAWTANNDDNLNLGYTSQSYWVKVNFVLPTSPHPYVLEIAYPVLDSLKLYLISADKVINYSKLGDKQTFSDRPIQHHNYLVPIESDVSGELELYIKVNSSSAIQLPVRLWSQQAFYESDQFNMLFLGIYFGLMSVMAVYNLLMYFSLKDKTQLYYVVYVSAIIAFYFSLSGLGFRYLWQNSLWWNDQSILFF